jgi:hypothetical protein
MKKIDAAFNAGQSYQLQKTTIIPSQNIPLIDIFPSSDNG